MQQYVTGETIRLLRERKGLKQKELADLLCVSDKTVSKWETGRGLPDSSLLQPLAAALGVSLTELFAGELQVNCNRSANMLRGKWYVCPVCGNVLRADGEGSFSCCGVGLLPQLPEAPDEEHALRVEKSDGEWYVTLNHPMTRAHSIGFLAYVTADRVDILRLYPEGDAAGRFALRGPGMLYAYCNRHGLFAVRVGR